MLFGPDGESIRYIPPPPPPPPTPRQLQAQVDGAQTAVTRDQSQIGALNGDLGRAENQDAIRVQQVIQLEAEIRALQAQLKADQAAANKAQDALNTALATQLPSQTTQALKNYGAAAAHAPGSLDMTTATTQLQTATFNQEVLYYEQHHGGNYAVPGSQTWQKDAKALLGNQSALQTARVAVALANGGQAAASGLNVQHFGAQEWAGEAIAAAQMPDLQTASDSKGGSPTLEQKSQAEKSATLSLSHWLTSLNDPATGIDPQLGRQALLGNGYVTTLGHEITSTMHDISVSKGQTSADGIGFLFQTVHQGGVDLGLAAVLIGVAAPQLRQFLHDQSTASADQASQAFVFAAGLYDVLLNARHAGVAEAGTLAQQLAQWSYSAANASNAATDNGLIDNKVATLLAKLLNKIKDQHVAPNLLYAWEGLSAGAAENDKNLWGLFKAAVDRDADLKAWAPVGAKPPTAVPLTPDQVHGNFDKALGVVNGQQQSGALPSDINPVVFAAVQTEMAGGYTSKDDVALARAMIAGQQQQLELGWQQQHHGQPVLMPVNAMTAQAGKQVLALGNQIGLGGTSWSDAVSQGLRGMQAAAPTAPSRRIINDTDAAYTRLRKAQASGNASAITTAQQEFDQAVMRELRAVYGNHFSGDSLVNDNENSDWKYQAEVQVMRDHASSTGMIQQVAVGLQAGEIVDLSFQPGEDTHNTVLTLDTQLAALQQPGAVPGSDPVTQAVLSDPRVQSLINGQVGVATAGAASDPTAALKHEAGVIAWYDQNDSTGVVGQRIITGAVGSGLTRQILATASNTAASNYDPLGTAAPLMQAAQASPTLTLAVYNDFNLPVAAIPGPPSPDALPPNALTAAAGSVRSATDYRNLAIIYGALPDGLPQGQAAKVSLIRAFEAELSQPHSTAAQNVANWIPASFEGQNSAPAALAHDLTTGYQYVAGDKIATVGKVGNSQLVSTIQGALSQQTSKGDSSTPFFGSAVNMAAAASADGSTLQVFDSDASFTAYVAQAYGIQPTSGAGTNAVYDPNAVVYGRTTLGQIVTDLKRQAGVTSLGVDNPIVVQAAPVAIGEQQAAQFRVQQQDGSIVWLGPDGAVTPGWHGQDVALTQHVSTTVVQVVGGVVEADPFGNVIPLLKTDTVPPPQPSHPWWESVAEDALAVTVGLVGSVFFDPVVGFAAAFAVQQLFDVATNNGRVTEFKYAYDLVRGKVTWKETKQFAVDTAVEEISAAADAFAPGAAKFVAGRVIDTVVADTAIDVGANAGTDAAAATATDTAATATDAAATATQSSSKAAIIAAKWNAASFGQKALAGTFAAGAQSVVQAPAGLANAAFDLSTQGQLNWSTFRKAAYQQGLDIVLGTVTGGVSGGLPANIVVQTAAGFGSGLLISEVDNQVFDHRNLTADDWLAALIMTVPMTAQHYTERADGSDQIKDALGASVPRAPDIPQSSEGEPALLSGSGEQVPIVPGPAPNPDTFGLSADYHPQHPSWVLSPKTRAAIAAMLEEWNASGAPPVSLKGLSIKWPSGGPSDTPSGSLEQAYRKTGVPVPPDVFRLLVRADATTPASVPSISVDGESWISKTFDEIPAAGSPRGYTAISYTWGRELAPHPFEAPPAVIAARTKPVVDTTIRSLNPKAVWVDALLIPQKYPERGIALRSMGAFYAHSEHTVTVLSRDAAAALADIRNTGRIDQDHLQTLAGDPWVTRAWTYQELVNSDSMSFLAEGDREPPIPAETLLNALGHTLAQVKQSRGLDSFGLRATQDSLDRLEDALGDWISSELGSRFASQSMVGMSRREAELPADLFAAQFGALRPGLVPDPPDPKVYPAEDLMKLSEERHDYSFIYSTAANRSTTPGKRWRPIGEPGMKPLLSWHTFGQGQPGAMTPTHLRLDNMWPVANGRLTDSAEQFIGSWLNSGPSRDVTPSNLSDRLSSAGLNTSGPPLELQGGYFFPENDIADVSSYRVFVATGVRWVHGAPGLLVRPIPGKPNQYEFGGVGVFIGPVPSHGKSINVT